jgi:hypothetical protein
MATACYVIALVFQHLFYEAKAKRRKKKFMYLASDKVFNLEIANNCIFFLLI